MRWKIGVLLMAWIVPVVSFGQEQQKIEDPAHWSYEAKKVNGDEYELTFKLKLDEGWHIWSLNPGGDGYEIVPSFTFDKGVTVKSKLAEVGYAKTVEMDGVENKVTYLSGNVLYQQVVAVKGKGKVSGEHEYQVCNDNLCLPPKKVRFEIDLTP
ncbi:MAG: hypothetical protein JNL72_10265 [Flavipsychrobacter sp.]|nr:hypothetical protein [Flavipsychrobacter sp.]